MLWSVVAALQPSIDALLLSVLALSSGAAFGADKTYTLAMSPSRITRAAPAARTLAMAGEVSKSGTSPKKSPDPRTATTASLPKELTTDSFTRPS